VLVPRHVAIVMDGNGRWAEERGLPRAAGHRAGLKPVRLCVEQCSARGVEALTLFAFSSENWRRPPQEVGILMQIFLEALDREVDELASKGVAVGFIGERATLAPELQARMAGVEARTGANRGLKLIVAIGYGGRWDIVTAAQRLAAACRAGTLEPEAIDEVRFGAELALAKLPEPDLFIRTGGEQRISNFLLWNLAYSELWFTDAYWPAFDAAELERAFAAFSARERRFGRIGAGPQADAC
jgi:undecaprenyl diphosphate synthase